MRLRMSVQLGPANPPPTPDPQARPLRATDDAALASLMLDAYRGTVDDEGDGPEEARQQVARVFGGTYGPFDFDASEVTLRDSVIVAATLVTEYEGLPMVAYSMTAPAWQRRGL